MEGSAPTLPWGQEVLQRLRTAHKHTRDMFEGAVDIRDFHQGTEIANYWAFVTLCYSGIVQSIKVLIAYEREVTIEQLLILKEAGKWKYRSHDVGRLFSLMDDNARRVLRDYYSRFQSLHNYIDVDNVEEFLNLISGPSGNGYERWRYSLIETEGEIPRISVVCMLSIWSALVALIRSRFSQERRKRGITMPEDEMRKQLRLTSILASGDDLCGNALSSVARIFWELHRGICLRTERFDWWSDLLRGAVSSTENNRSNIAMFISRAIGKCPTGISVRWNDNSQRFEDIPWNLPKRVTDAVPGGAQGFPPEEYDELLRSVYRRGFSVCENLSGIPMAPKWSCTLVAKKKHESGEMLILRVWAQKYAPHLQIELDGSDTWEATPIQDWLQ